MTGNTSGLRIKDRIFMAADSAPEPFTSQDVATVYRRLFGFKTQPTPRAISNVLISSGRYETNGRSPVLYERR